MDTIQNLRTALLDVRRMGEADRLAVVAGTPATDLMENAGKVVAREIAQRWSLRSVIVLCGPGNNGGDGFVVARLLHEAGWPVRVALLGQPDRLTGPAQHHMQRWHQAIEPMTPDVLDGAELMVDAIFGAGLSRALEGATAETLAAAADRRLPIVAIDVPSGVMGDTGDSLGAVATTLTVTFFRKKPGHLLLPGRSLCGELVVGDIGIASSTLEQVAPDTFENDPGLWISQLPRALDAGSKHTGGHALIVGGYPMTGAARIAARAAAQAGAGLTTIAVPGIALPAYAAALTGIAVKPFAGLETFKGLLQDRSLSALMIGPGAGTGEETRSWVLAMLAAGRPTLLDADALTAFENDPPALDRAINGPCVLTPHDGEFRCLFDPSGDKLTRTRAAARRCGAVVILKGSDTVIAAPDGRTIIDANAPPTLAIAGAGDVLDGIVLGLLAQGMAPFPAAAAAVWLHGAAAGLCPGHLAEDLPDVLPRVLRRLGIVDGSAAG